MAIIRFDTTDRSFIFRARALEGSDKQISWANDIRSKAVKSVMFRIADNPTRKELFLADKFHGLFLTRIQDAINSRASAKWWIDNRSSAEQVIGAEAAAAVQNAKAAAAALASAARSSGGGGG